MIVGIDPGFTGAIAFLSDKKNKLLGMWDMPIIYIMKKKQVNAKFLAQMLKQISNDEPISLVAIEDVHAMPHDGVVSAFRFGYNAGILMGVCKSLELNVLRIKPSVWKPALGLTRHKNDSINLARETFPDYMKYFKRQKDDGRAEAALIAHFARENL